MPEEPAEPFDIGRRGKAGFPRPVLVGRAHPAPIGGGSRRRVPVAQHGHARRGPGKQVRLPPQRRDFELRQRFGDPGSRSEDRHLALGVRRDEADSRVIEQSVAQDRPVDEPGMWKVQSRRGDRQARESRHPRRGKAADPARRQRGENALEAPRVAVGSGQLQGARRPDPRKARVPVHRESVTVRAQRSGGAAIAEQSRMQNGRGYRRGAGGDGPVVHRHVATALRERACRAASRHAGPDDGHRRPLRSLW